jgi:hypothetical protein
MSNIQPKILKTKIFDYAPKKEKKFIDIIRAVRFT